MEFTAGTLENYRGIGDNFGKFDLVRADFFSLVCVCVCLNKEAITMNGRLFVVLFVCHCRMEKIAGIWGEIIITEDLLEL